uniref:Uncharacterized protein n=1 Tax=Arundo donax TaxID=35708 RepID=A0A0A8YSV0_ARUDO
MHTLVTQHMHCNQISERSMLYRQHYILVNWG